MPTQLEPLTEVGRKVVGLAEEHAADVALRADQHDREGSFPFENIEAMKASGFAGATVPVEFGGLGLDSLHDLAVALSRLGRGDGSTAIAVNMHLTTGWVVAHLLRGAREAGDDAQAGAMAGFASLLGGGAIALANVTEPGTDFLHPMTEATKTEGGWLLNGRKSFGTLSPMADVMTVTVKLVRDGEPPGSGTAVVFRGAEGQEIRDNWDAMGMRASGSHDVAYRDCFVPDDLMIEDGVPWGTFTVGSMVIGVAGNMGLIASFLGIAEAARDQVFDLVRTRTKQPSGRVLAERQATQRGAADLETKLLTARAVLSWIGRRADETLVARPVADVGMDDLHALAAEFQSAKLVVNRTAIEAVDVALQLSGGAGYLTASPLSRLYRDVRAGPFMQPFSPNEAPEYIGRVALGLEPGVEG